MVRRLDKNDAIEFVDLMSPDTTCPISRQFMLDRFHAQENGVLLSGAAAFVAMWRAVPFLRPLGVAAQLPGVLPILEYGYRLFLRLRPRLQRYAGGRLET
ncbi:DCC1-like thiol-disulfide oxidoreductase family protein [Parasphingorhabdus halotolerans]|nr:DCC1-like thiol-disulfide oxidoreductase family protein [Parasphingorhabdus halotolerans]